MKFHARKFVAKLIAAGKVDPTGTWCVDMPDPANPKEGRPYRLFQLRRATDNQVALFVDDGLTRYPHGEPKNGRQHLLNQLSKVAKELDDGTELPMYFSDELLPADQRKVARNITIKAANDEIIDFLEESVKKNAAAYKAAQDQFKRMRKQALADERAEVTARDRADAILATAPKKKSSPKKPAAKASAKENAA